MKKILIHIDNILHTVSEEEVPFWEQYIEIDKNTTLADVVGLADLSQYYPLSGAFSFNNQDVPYIISGNQVLWNQEYKNVKVTDFLETHNIETDIIMARGGYAQAGGPGFLDLKEIWESLYPVLDQIMTVTGAVGLTLGVWKRISTLFQKKEVPPHSCFDVVFSRERWNHFELAELLEITPDDAKEILRVAAYHYDRTILMYVQRPEAALVREKILGVKIHDI